MSERKVRRVITRHRAIIETPEVNEAGEPIAVVTQQVRAAPEPVRIEVPVKPVPGVPWQTVTLVFTCMAEQALNLAAALENAEIPRTAVVGGIRVEAHCKDHVLLRIEGIPITREQPLFIAGNGWRGTMLAGPDAGGVILRNVPDVAAPPHIPAGWSAERLYSSAKRAVGANPPYVVIPRDHPMYTAVILPECSRRAEIAHKAQPHRTFEQFFGEEVRKRCRAFGAEGGLAVDLNYFDNAMAQLIADDAKLLVVDALHTVTVKMCRVHASTSPAAVTLLFHVDLWWTKQSDRNVAVGAQS